MADSAITVTLLPVLTALVGSGSTLLAVHLTNRSSTNRLNLQLDNEAKKRTADVRRDRGEELYTAVERWMNALSGNYIALATVMQGKITYNDYLDLVVKKEGSERTYEPGRIELLVDVYFPSVRCAYDVIITARAELNKVAQAHKSAYSSGALDGTRFIGPYVRAQKAVEKAHQDFRRVLIEQIRST